MPAPSAIVSFSHDVHLLQSREGVFRIAGYRTWSTLLLDELEGLLLAVKPQLQVLCHTLPEPECAEAQRLAAEQQPPVRCLVLTAGEYACAAPPSTSRVTAQDGPTKLLSAIAQLIDAKAQTFPHLNPEEGSHGTVRRQRSLVQ